MAEEIKDNLELERNELNRLIGRGIEFELHRTIYVRPKGFFGRLQKRVPHVQTLKYTIYEPTLSTLDRLSKEQIELAIDDTLMATDAGINEAKRLTSLHSKRLAKIVALAVLGQDYVKMVQEGPRTNYLYDDKKLNELTELFFQCIKPSKLMQLVITINTMENLGDFCNSIRLLSAQRTTMPDRIEKKV